MDQSMLEFAQNYEPVFKPKFQQKVDEFFDSLVKESAVNVQQNHESSEQYRKYAADVEHLDKQIGKYRGWRGFFIFLAVLAFGAAVTMIVLAILDYVNNGGGKMLMFALIGVGCIALGVGMVLLVTKRYNKLLKDLQAKRDAAQAVADKQYNECMAQVAPLHRLLWRSKLYQIIEETLPTVKFDLNFNMKRYDLLNGKYGLSENTNPDQSTVGLISGEVLGNPFVEERRFCMNMGTQVYTGSIVISWTESYTDSEGHSHTRMRSETLFASVEKPKPFYKYLTRMVFGCEAAPNLSFSHQPTHAEDLSEGQLERKVKRDAKALQKQARKAATTGNSGFTEMANQEFDALFNAEDRDNEVEFRLMFTPLAQKNMLYLMKMKEPYGDDFDFTKHKMLNFITSEHGQTWQFEEDNSAYMKYDVALCREAMKAYYQHFFQNFFFEIAPLLSIPLYQQHKSTEYIYKTKYHRNFTGYESEVLANCFSTAMFAHPETETDVILKTQLLAKGANVDELTVEAHGFRTVQHTEYVTKLGGDGNFHQVPVDWVEYIPVSRTSEIDMTTEDGSNAGGSRVTKHGLAASYIKYFADRDKDGE